ncbi:MAG: porphobilinogen synthase [Gemmatales bacterium]|nr:porphobilinogen synthase [Gemmatales bacterium]MDW7995745.1 porphobilinogen synthase [Gemmatales bacterium]
MSPLGPRFPELRLRRLRRLPALRELVRETELSPSDFILPLFVRPGQGIRREIPSMPGQFQLSPDTLAETAARAWELGIRAVILFGIPPHKDETGSSALDEAGIIPQAIRALKRQLPDLIVITDECFCEYTSHGHCGVLSQHTGRLDVDNDRTLELLGQQCVVHARAGADIVAPSGMMDGMVAAIRRALDAAGFSHIPILSYAAKYASAFYGPFREAAESPPQFGDRSTYQMDPANANEALREIALDLAEGADLIMVKPALAYLDIIQRAKQQFRVPLAAYNVSGEYAMIKAAAARGWLDERRVVLEILTCIKRAGADLILTYHALDAALWLKTWSI